MSLCGLAGSLNPIRPCFKGWQVLKSWEHKWQRAYPIPPISLMFLSPTTASGKVEGVSTWPCSRWGV